MMESLAWGLNLAVLAIFFVLVPRLPRERTWARSLLVFVVLGLWCRYLVWRVTSTAPVGQASDGAWLFFAVALIIEILMFLSMTLFLVTLSRYANRSPEADRHEERLRSLPAERLPTVDVFIPTYNEDREIVERGIIAAKELDYPRFRVWVLDDGRRDWLRDLCAQREVGYIRRPDNRHAKAGNVNHALKATNGELFVVFDADFTPHRNFLYRTVGFFFADPRVTIVQTPQHFYNPDVFQVNLGLSDLMQDNEREWFDEILCSRDAWDCAFCCGTCAVFRRDAIEKIGGIATESVTEDILTTVRLLPHGCLTRYLNERLSIGMAPENANSLLIQRRRWTRGHIQMMFLMFRKYGSGLTFLQWLMFFPFHYLLNFPCQLLFALLPLVFLWTGLSHFYVGSTAELVAYQGPALIASFLLSRWFLPHARVPLLSSAIYFYLSARTFPTVLATLVRPFGAPFRVTPKGRANIGKGGDPIAIWGLIVLIVLTVGGIIVGCNSAARSTSPTGLIIATGWAFCNLVLFGLTLLAVAQQPRLRGEERFPISRSGSLTGRGWTRTCSVVDLSLSGVFVAGVEGLDVGDEVRFSLDGIGPFLGRIVRKAGRNEAGIQFGEMPAADRDRLVVYLFTSDLTNQIQEMNPFCVLWQLLKGAVFGPRRSMRHEEAAESSEGQSQGPRDDSATAGANFSEDLSAGQGAAGQPQSDRTASQPRPLAAIHCGQTR
jgi:cellulose synthase (UDP-forming)